jgi:hypothetical protein
MWVPFNQAYRPMRGGRPPDFDPMVNTYPRPTAHYPEPIGGHIEAGFRRYPSPAQHQHQNQPMGSGRSRGAAGGGGGGPRRPAGPGRHGPRPAPSGYCGNHLGLHSDTEWSPHAAPEAALPAPQQSAPTSPLPTERLTKGGW